MSFNYRVVEPHPTATTPYIHTARGGAGNVAKATAPAPTRGSDTTGPASRTLLEHKKSSTYAAGRGGMGNIRPSSERTMFSFDEELEQQLRQERDLAPVVHVGRGGAGNKVYIDGSVRAKSTSSDNASSKSNSSAESGADVATRNVRKTLGKGWSKMVGVGSYMIG